MRGRASAERGEVLEWGLTLGVHVLQVDDEVEDLVTQKPME
jgi:hypothetical protein